jgi:hypothetical protein
MVPNFKIQHSSYSNKQYKLCSTQLNSVALSPQAKYTDWATATCGRNLVPTFADRGVSRSQRGGSPTVVNLSFLNRTLWHLVPTNKRTAIVSEVHLQINGMRFAPEPGDECGRRVVCGTLKPVQLVRDGRQCGRQRWIPFVLEEIASSSTWSLQWTATMLCLLSPRQKSNVY